MISVVRYATIVVLLSSAALRAYAQPAEPRFFPDTGYRIDDDGFWSYFQQRGGVNTFGFPASHAFQFLGCTVQFFQRLVMQRCGNAGVGTLNLLDDGLLPYTTIAGSTFPGPSDAMAASAPKPDDPNYGAVVVTFVRSNAPDVFEDQPVNFGQTFFNTITPDMAGTDDPAILGLLDLEIWGLPTSQPAYEPTNSDFIYQRFQRGIMHYDKGCRCTRGLLLADYLKALITGQNLPQDLAQQAIGSPLLLSAVNGQPPAGTDYTGAFDGVDVAGISVVSATPTNPTPTSTPVPANVEVSASSTPVPATSTPAPTGTPVPELSRNDPPTGTLSQTLAVNEPIGNANCGLPTDQPFAITPLQTDNAQTNSFAGPFEFPALPTVCFSLPDPNSTQVQIKASPVNSVAAVASETVTPTTSGWFWPQANSGGPPAAPGKYVVTASRGSATATATVTIDDDPATRTPHILVLPRRGTPGNTTFHIYAGGLKPNTSAPLRVYRCTARPDQLQNCQSSGGPKNANFAYVTSLGPVQIDSAGHASLALHTSAGEPETQFVVLTDDMLKNFNGQLIGMGRAWFCTTMNPSCATE